MLAVMVYENAWPPVPVADAALVMTGKGGALTVSVTVAVPEVVPHGPLAWYWKLSGDE